MNDTKEEVRFAWKRALRLKRNPRVGKRVDSRLGVNWCFSVTGR